MAEVFRVFHAKSGAYYTHLGNSLPILVNGVANPIFSECNLIGKAKYTEGDKQGVWVYRHPATDQYYHVGAGDEIAQEMVFYTNYYGQQYLRPKDMFWEPIELEHGTWPRFSRVGTRTEEDGITCPIAYYFKEVEGGFHE